MSLYNENYEFSLRNVLPANSRDLVDHLFTTYSLAQMLELWESRQSDPELLKRFKVQEKEWPLALQAALIAKFSYIDIHKKFSAEELYYLVKSACAVLGQPLNEYSLNEVISAQQNRMPLFSAWLYKIAQMIQIRHA